MDLSKLGEILSKRVDQKGLAKDLAVLLLLPLLEKIVKDSSNTFDDKAFEIVKKYIEEKL
jgi:hypothetical protein